MNYREDLGYVYPERSDEHMITVKHLRDTNFDEKFNYLDKSFFYKVKRVIRKLIFKIHTEKVGW